MMCGTYTARRSSSVALAVASSPHIIHCTRPAEGLIRRSRSRDQEEDVERRFSAGMIDTWIPGFDYARSKAFYTQALARSAKSVMEMGADVTESCAPAPLRHGASRTSGSAAKADWRSRCMCDPGETRRRRRVPGALAAAAKTTAPAYGRTIMPTLRPFVPIRTATTSKPSATRRLSRATRRRAVLGMASTISRACGFALWRSR